MQELCNNRNCLPISMETMSAKLVLTVASAALMAAAGTGGPAPSRLDTRFVDGSGEEAAMPRPAILLFYATWCVPCHIEIRSIDNLVRAAGPVPIIIVPINANPTTKRALRGIRPAQIRYAVGGTYRFLASLAGPSNSLPVAVALNVEGAPCAIKREGLTAVEIEGFLAPCRG